MSQLLLTGAWGTAGPWSWVTMLPHGPFWDILGVLIFLLMALGYAVIAVLKERAYLEKRRATSDKPRPPLDR